MNNTNTILLISASVLIMICIGIYVYTEYYKDDVKILKKKSAGNKPACKPRGREVYNIGNNLFSYNNAVNVCKSLNGELADLDQVMEAYNSGANWCNYGWIKGQMGVYPTQRDSWEERQTGPLEKRAECGLPGVNGGYFENPEFLFGATCYGVKPKDLRVKEENRLVDSSDYDAYYKDQDLNKLNILPFNNKKWNQ